MNRFILIPLFLLGVLFESSAQTYSPGQNAEGGIVFPTSKKKGFVVAEKGLGLMTWEEGKKACEDLVLNGYDNWRLPSKTELGIIYYQFYMKGIGGFPTEYYWCKTENKGIRQLAWCLDFKDGQEYNSHSKTNNKYILPVRTY
ncbi:MAG: DUF1566 domain-containing protein [Chitinophagaceae bacterium]